MHPALGHKPRGYISVQVHDSPGARKGDSADLARIAARLVKVVVERTGQGSIGLVWESVEVEVVESV